MTSDLYACLKRKPFFFIVLSIFASSLMTTGCDQKEQKPSLLQQTVKKYDKATTLEGIITDDKGPLKSGTIKVTDSKGKHVAEAVLENSEHYQVKIPAGTVLPIILTYFPDENVADAKKLMTAVVHPNLTQFDINPLSTQIAEKAKELGGYTYANLVTAAEKTGTVPDDNKTTAGFRGDPTTQYGGWH